MGLPLKGLINEGHRYSPSPRRTRDSKEDGEDNSKYDSKEEEVDSITVTTTKLATTTKSSIVNNNMKPTNA